MKIDLKDRKILYQLDLDCRQSNTQIGKKVGLKKDVVSYRINQMEEEGLIKNYLAVIDTFKLGYDVFRIYLNFQYTTPEIKNKIIQYFVDYKNSWVVATVKSEIDLDVVVWVKNIYDFYKFWNNTLDKYEEYFEKYTISIYIKSNVYEKSYLLPEADINEDRVICEMDCGQTPVEIDKLDYKILNELAENARASLVDLADKFDCSSQTIKYRIKNLVKSEVIKAFRVNIDNSKLDLQGYKVDIYLKNHKMKRPILKYLQSKPYVQFMNLALGWADLEPEFVVKNLEELMDILDEINSKFSGAIKKQSFFIAEEFHKIRCLPELF